MKKVLSAIICLAMVLSLTVFAYAETEGNYTYTVTDGKAEITDYSGTGSTATIPATLGGYPVTRIGYRAFYGCSGLTTITISDSVTYINEESFSGCTKLTSITIPDRVTGISISAFYGCTGLTSITIPDSVTSIGEWAFRGCTGLTSVTIGNGVKNIGRNAFDDCTSLTEINVYEDNEDYSSIDGVLFNKSLKKLVRYPEGKTGTAYTIPDSVTSIGDCAFYGCTGLTSIAIPNGVTEIGYGAFICCSALTSIVIPDCVTSIDGWAFKDCTSLASITILDSVTYIGSWSLIPTNATIYGYIGSKAQEYAIEYGNEFVVIEVSGITVSTLPTKTTYYTGETFDKAGLVVTATYSTAYSVAVTADVSLLDMTTAGTKTVTVTYGGKTATFEITVNEKQVLAGDVNGDGEVTTADSRLVLLYALGDVSVIVEEYFEAADYNCNGGVTTSDARLVLVATLE